MTRPRRSGVRLLLLAAVAGGAIAAGCSGKPRVDSHGQLRIVARYAWGDLRAELPPETTIESAQVAAERVLRGRGLSITETRSHNEHALVAASPAGAGKREQTVVTLERRSRTVRVTIEVKPNGDEASSRAILESMLTQLGM